MSRPAFTAPLQYGDTSFAIYVRPEPTNGDPERRTRSAIAQALDRARELTEGFPGFKVRVGWRDHGDIYVRGGEVYLTIGRGGRREYARGGVA